MIKSLKNNLKLLRKNNLFTYKWVLILYISILVRKVTSFLTNFNIKIVVFALVFPQKLSSTKVYKFEHVRVCSYVVKMWLRKTLANSQFIMFQTSTAVHRMCLACNLLKEILKLFPNVCIVILPDHIGCALT